MTWPPRWRRELREPIPETDSEPVGAVSDGAMALLERWKNSDNKYYIGRVACRTCPTCQQPCPIEGFKAHTDWCKANHPEGANDGM